MCRRMCRHMCPVYEELMLEFIPFIAKCSFEDLTKCGFTQMDSDDFDFTPQSQKTASTGTGPLTDHTYGTAQG